MSNILKGLTGAIGKTPLIELSKLAAKHKSHAVLLAKAEFMNPTGSVKDRAAFAMVDVAERMGQLRKNGVIIEPTSGNTGIALAAIGATKGYRVILAMPDNMSAERRELITAYGAEIVLTEADKGMTGAIAEAKALAARTPNSFIPSQFENPENPMIHYNTTGPEIWQDSGEKVDILVAGVGTGGTISGAGIFLKGVNPYVEIYAVEPKESPVLSGGAAGAHGVQGIGAGFIPEVLNREVYKEIITVSTQDALDTARELTLTEGLLTGPSSGAALFAALSVAKNPKNRKKTIVVILPDSGARYPAAPVSDEARAEE